MHNNIQIYEFLDGDLNPTVKKIGQNGEFTDELYNKDDVVNTLSQAVKSGDINSVVKEYNPNTPYLKYHFNVGDNEKIYSTISVRIKNNKLASKTVNIPISSNSADTQSKYIRMLDSMVTENIKVKQNQKKKEILSTLAAGAFVVTVMSGMAYSLIKMDMKEQEINSKTNQQYIEQFNMDRYKNGVPPLEQTVDAAIEQSTEDVLSAEVQYEENSHGRKL